MSFEEGILNSYRQLSRSGYYSPDYPPPPVGVLRFLSTYSEEDWNLVYNTFTEATNNINSGGFNACSVTCTLADGTVYYDTRSENSYQKFKEGTIAPNQNISPGFMKALKGPAATTYEYILNENTLEKEYSTVTRMGTIVEPKGIVKFTLSFKKGT